MGIVGIIKTDPEFQRNFKIEEELFKKRVASKDQIIEKIIQIILILGKILFILFLTYLSFILISAKFYEGVFPFDNANVVIHELGHNLYRVLFSFMRFINPDVGEFMHVLGGSLNQVLVPEFKV